MTTPLSRAEYRPDIDGLRAVAVIGVVLFHLGYPFIQGGFAGVDVFFVISGYLITGIIVRGLEKGTFTISGFYVRRINRIVPALLLVLFSVWLAGWVVMFATEFDILGRDVFGGATFISNFFFARGVGYWDTPQQPLLHLWSLAVEEQFYLFWPLTVWLVWRTNRNVRWTIIAIIELSFAVNIYFVRHSGAVNAFFLPFSRFWEILAGALLLQVENSGDSLGETLRSLHPRARDAMSLAGALLLAATVGVARDRDLWPAFLGILPVAGTMLLIGAGPLAVVNRALLSRRWMVAIGLISYPLYLWHYPVIVFGRILFGNFLPLWYHLVVIVGSLALAAATYHYIEKPIRFGKRKKRSAIMLLPGLAAAGVLGLIAWTGMAGTRLEASVVHTRKKWGNDVMHPKFLLSEKGRPLYFVRGNNGDTLVVWGDSHADQYWPRIEKLDRERATDRPTAILMATHGCPVFPETNQQGVDPDGKPWACPQFNRDAWGLLSRPGVKTVVVSDYWEIYMRTRRPPGHQSNFLFVGEPDSERRLKLFEDQLAQLVKSGKRVFIVLSNPIMQNDILGNLPRRLGGWGSGGKMPMSTTKYHLDLTAHTSTRLRQIAERAGATIIDPTPYVCGKEMCPAYTSEGEPIYRDQNHFRAGFVRNHAVWLDQVFSH